MRDGNRGDLQVCPLPTGRRRPLGDAPVTQCLHRGVCEKKGLGHAPKGEFGVARVVHCSCRGGITRRGGQGLRVHLKMDARRHDADVRWRGI